MFIEPNDSGSIVNRRAFAPWYMSWVTMTEDNVPLTPSQALPYKLEEVELMYIEQIEVYPKRLYGNARRLARWNSCFDLTEEETALFFLRLPSHD